MFGESPKKETLVVQVMALWDAVKLVIQKQHLSSSPPREVLKWNGEFAGSVDV